ncbi:phage portal protein [Streptomyces sp. N2-109]|uniref:Phage portal protein n=1 Tax=Streptomyces gossypii TaxID=2883101 RepID=A0ABT2JTC7_9ACTN|nr:phage portal protein [Streptomyces gossypii]MCT2591141.1 phage portal protein [Streptomyces gossypii]
MRSPLRALFNQAAQTPVPFVSRAHSFALPFGMRRDAEAQMSAMSSVGTLFAIVNRTSNATALVDWKLWRKAKSGRAEDRTEVTSHAALDLWRKPNAYMPRQEFVETTQQHIDLTGEGWWVIGRDPRSTLPLELWPVRPDRMEPVPDPERFLKGYVYLGPAGERVPLELNDVVQLRMPNPLDPYRGMGPVQSVLADLDATKYSAEWNRSFFLNSAEPGGIIEVPNGLDDNQFDELRDRWNEQHRGVANAHRVAILEHGVWKDRKLSQRDMQFVELRDVSSKVIREAFGMPKFAVGDVEDVNRASAEASMAWFAEQLTVPRLERIKAALNHDLLPLYGASANGLEFDYESPVPPNPAARNEELTAQAAAAQSLRAAGYLAADVLAAVGLPEMQARTPEEELLVDIVRGAPSTAPVILPLLGFDLSAAALASSTGAEPSNRLELGSEAPELEAAMRWKVVATLDDDTCQPCRDNDGHLYRNREQAYEDYPGGSGYVHCVGAEYGNECRCRVVKRRQS